MKTQKIVSKTGFKREVLQSLRVQGGHNMTDLANKLDVDLSTVSLWESGDRRPSPKKLKEIASFFKVPISTFFLVILFCSLAHASDIAIKTIIGEASGEGLKGEVAVANVIRNRAKANTWYGQDVDSVCLKKWQFSFWNDKALAEKKLSKVNVATWQTASKAWAISEDTDVTDGATHYCRWDSWPKWRTDRRMIFIRQIGQHVFYKEVNK